MKAAFSGDAMNFGRIGVTPPSRPGEPRALPALTGVPGAFSAIGSGAPVHDPEYVVHPTNGAGMSADEDACLSMHDPDAHEQAATEHVGVATAVKMRAFSAAHVDVEIVVLQI